MLKSTKDVRSFLGITRYYRRFIKKFASIARPLNDLLVGHRTLSKKKGQQKSHMKTRFVWTDRQQKSFDTLKEKLSNPQIIAYADYSLTFSLHTDASYVGLGAALYQKRDGQDQVLSFASMSLKPSEKTTLHRSWTF